MCKLGCSVWHTEMPPRRILIHQVQFNLECLTTLGSTRKGNPFIWRGLDNPPLSIFFFLSFKTDSSINFFLTLKVTVVIYSIPFQTQYLSLDLIANNDVVLNQDRLIKG